jgi:DNA-binding XRE family transcriptional regulator
MGKAGQVLKKVLAEFEVSQYSFAVALDIKRNSVYRWANENRDPSAKTALEIVRALKTLNLLAAKAFLERYLGEEVKDL